MVQGREQRRLSRLAIAMNQKARQRGVKGLITAADLAYLEKHQGTCAYCRVKLEVGHGTFDHQIPFDRGGSNHFHNLKRCCTACQREKFTKTSQEYDEYRQLMATCLVCKKVYKPRWAEWRNGKARTCSHECAARLRWIGKSLESASQPPS